MASAFWYLRDGRGFARRVQLMMDLMASIHEELKENSKAEAFFIYLKRYVPKGNFELNGHGGFFYLKTGKEEMMNIDFREFTPKNQTFFWQAAQSKLGKLRIASPNEPFTKQLQELVEMNHKAKRGEHPMEHSDLNRIIPATYKKRGPGWALNEEEIDYLIKYYLTVLPLTEIRKLRYPYLNQLEIKENKKSLAALIIDKHSKKVFFNYCMDCGRLARTPQAKQCRYCGLDWH